MKNLGLLWLGSALIVAWSASPVQALPVFKTGFQKRYNLEAKVVTCDVCHVPMKDKKEFRNDYGQVLANLLDAEQFKGDSRLEGDAADKTIFEALDKAAKEKAKDGKTWEEHIKALDLEGLKK